MDKDELIAVLRELDQQLSSPFDIILIGGAAMILHFGASRATRDVDVLVLRGEHSQLQHAVKAVANGRDLPEDWLNDAAKGLPRFYLLTSIIVSFHWTWRFVTFSSMHLGCLSR